MRKDQPFIFLRDLLREHIALSTMKHSTMTAYILDKTTKNTYETKMI
jgi:hypothetical protein